MAAVPKPHGLSPEQTISTTFEGDLAASAYSAFFGAAISAEVKALAEQCLDFDMYQVQIHPAVADPRPSTYLLHVPGLRENSLRIEFGDVVQLRPIRIGKKQVSLRNANGQVLPHATTKQYNAMVWNIDRMREMLTLRIDSLHQSSALFNVRFTVQSERMDALQRSVTVAQRHITSNENQWMRSM